MKSFLHDLAAGLFMRAEGAAQKHRIARKRRELSQLCIADPSVIADFASVLNPQGTPDAIHVGANTRLLGQIEVGARSGKIVIGNKCYIGPNTLINSARSISIGNYVLISHYVGIYDNNSHSLSWRDRREEIDAIIPHLTGSRPTHNLHAEAVIIEDDVWIGFNSVVLKGVQIGRGAIVGAATVVSGDVPPFSLVVGNPMRIVRSLRESLDVDAERDAAQNKRPFSAED